ncbi:prepilin peptidase [Corynebacterium uberis]|uniref:prepilin peptidase n=1 Tax=Corynebacterium TaxID=1716 RepID=UPI001D0B0B98|nr:MULTISPECIES: prepilin peptidase [Corynebacterium]MCZ9308566.1 prepilin peptidase [Corynebacterium sp. c6VSa_13]UDL74216.1 prepilin peptidase [Corynebacterium uberis]UDL74904.1 prepilin peptidase [Corynebacterium uberis]UDL77118.1 prepilin peptidase [Corynebacterium uberis]UDL79401.1 prepilin peptidase [Corynebacterium uberis]
MWGFGVGIAVACVAAWACTLAWVDAREHRLPDVLTLPGVLVAWAVAAVLEPGWILGGLGWSACYGLCALWGRGMGGGDVKLAASLGVAVAVWGVLAWWVAVAAASALSVVFMLATRRRAVAHGPAMLLAAAAVWGLGMCPGWLPW